MLRSPVITWPTGLYLNGELAHVQIRSLSLEVVNLDILQHFFIVGLGFK
jgi:hypothetical protein